jgi:hypothetical protein
MSLRNLPQEKLEKELKKRGIPVKDIQTYGATEEGVKLYMRNGREIEIKDENLRMYARAAVNEGLLKELVGIDDVTKRLYALFKSCWGYPFPFEHFKEECEWRIVDELIERKNVIGRLVTKAYVLTRGYDSLLNRWKKEYESEIQDRLWEMLKEEEEYLRDYWASKKKSGEELSPEEFREKLRKEITTSIEVALLKKGIILPAGMGEILEKCADTQQLADFLTDLYREKCPLSPRELVDYFIREITPSHVKEEGTREDSFLPDIV